MHDIAALIVVCDQIYNRDHLFIVMSLAYHRDTDQFDISSCEISMS